MLAFAADAQGVGDAVDIVEPRGDQRDLEDAPVVEPDGAVPGDTLRFTDPDFRTRAVKVNAVLRWEYRPGSTLFIVWTQSRSGYVPYDAGFDLERDFRRELLRDRPTNVLLVKLNYWMSM